MILILIAVCVSMLLVCFISSLCEAVLLSLNPLWLKAQRDSQEHARRWLSLKSRIERPIAAILIFNTLGATGLATLAGAIFSETFGAHWMWLFSGTLATLVLIGGELTPKILGVRDAQRFAPLVIGPLTLMLRLCHPMVKLLELFSRRFESAPPQTTSDASSRIMDLITLAQAARAEQSLHNHEELIIIHAATLSARQVRHAMVPMELVRVFHRGRTLLQNVEDLGPKLHRSYPVTGLESIEHIAGYVRIRELFQQNIQQAEGAEWADLIRPVLKVQGRISLTQLLALFLEHQEIAALVHDESGRTIGWVTMDDVMKVLMGQRV